METPRWTPPPVRADEKSGLTVLEGRFRDESFCCARSEFATIERSFSPPCEGGVRGGEQGITGTFDRSGGPCHSAGAPCGASRTRTAYQASVPPGPPPLTPPSQGGKTRRNWGEHTDCATPTFHPSTPDPPFARGGKGLLARAVTLPHATNGLLARAVTLPHAANGLLARAVALPHATKGLLARAVTLSCATVRVSTPSLAHRQQSGKPRLVREDKRSTSPLLGSGLGERLERRTLLAASSLQSAVPLQFGILNDAEVSHFLSIPNEFDLYSVYLQSGETFDASIDAQSAGSGLESLLRVFSANGTPLALDNQQGGDPQLTFQAANAGTYLIGVSSAPNNNYNPLVADSGVPGGTTGLYTLDVDLETSTPPMPDLTGSSFRTGVDMAAAGDTVPVSFTVQNRGAADPGNFQVQVLLAANNLFDSSSQVLATFTRAELVTDATGRDFSSPAGFAVTVPAGRTVGAC